MIGERWGVTEAEVARRYPCDDLIGGPSVKLWRGVSVDASPESVWRWLRQVQLAPYSYDWIDNGGRRSPRELRPVDDPAPGDPFSTMAGRFPVGTVISVVPGEHLTCRIMGAVMSYVVVPDGKGSRLLLKIVVPGARWRAALVAVGDWPMARKQLLTFKRLAESSR